MEKHLILSDSFRNFLVERWENEKCIIAKILLRLKRYTPELKSYYIRKNGELECRNSNVESIWFNPLITTSECNYLTFRNNGTISYMPDGREQLFSENGDWKREGRQEAKPVRVLRKIIKKRVIELCKISDAQFENFTNGYKARYSSDGVRIEVWKNRDIPDVYEMERVDKGTLGGSCMNDGSKYLDMYKHCEDLRIVVMLNNENKLIGRALLWKIKAANNSMGIDFYFLDRFYTAYDHLYETFKDYAKKNDFAYKQDYTSYSDKQTLIFPNGEVRAVKMKIELDTEWESYPYIDTFTYGTDGWLSNVSGSWEYTYNNTDGTRDGDEERYTCEYTNRRGLSEDDSVYTYEDRYCYINSAVEVRTIGTRLSRNYGEYVWAYENDDDIIEVGGTYYFKESEEIRYSDRDDQWYDADSVVYSEYSEEYIHIDDAVLVENTNKYIHLDDIDEYGIVKVNGRFYKIDDSEIVFIDGNYYHETDANVAYDEETETHYILNPTN